ncbi:Meiotic recombination protein, partial [Lachnellula occidentalis]
MDFDLLSTYLADPQPSLPRTLLPHLPNSSLTPQKAASRPNGNPPTASGSSPVTRYSPGAVIAKIEDIFEVMTDCMLGQKSELVIPLKTRRRKPKAASDGDSGDNAPSTRKKAKSDTRIITFPSKSPREVWKFTALLRILELSHEALVTGIVTTKRDIYYRDPELFMKQTVVNQYVDDIAYTLGVERDALNVVAAAKGLVAGSFAITRKDSSIVDYSSAAEGILIPNPKEIQDINLDNVQWILVIEKEATFRTLASNQYWRDSQAGKGILITAKGYPDIQTRQFLRLLYTSFPELPILCLVDHDPDGIGIMSTYKHGSIALAHESATLAVSSIQWLGVRNCDFVGTGGDQEVDAVGLLKLTKRDRRIAIKMLEKADGHVDVEWKRELRIMLMLNVKAEIQVLGNAEALGSWLDGKLLDAVRI